MRLHSTMDTTELHGAVFFNGQFLTNLATEICLWAAEKQLVVPM